MHFFVLLKCRWNQNGKYLKKLICLYIQTIFKHKYKSEQEKIVFSIDETAFVIDITRVFVR